MSNQRQLLLIYLFQIVPLLIFPLETLISGIAIVGILVVVFALLGYGLWRGRNWALSLSITMQGFNVVIRLLMLFPNALMRLSGGGFVFDLPYLALSAVSIALSLFFLLRLDRPDIRATIVA
jgi:hypothetical protein